MATFTVGTLGSIDQSQLSVGSLLDGTTTFRSSTTVNIDQGDGEIITLSGTGFTFDSNGNPLSGTLTAIEDDIHGTLNVRISGFSLSAVQFAQFVHVDDTTGTFTNILGSNDTLTAGNFGDLLQGYAGNDLIQGAAGPDNLYGGAGADTLVGGDGNDHLYGQSASGGTDSADSLSGGNGSDYLQGNAGNDTLDGGDGSDRINGGANDDLITGGTGNDTVNGNLGNDTIDGGDGNDSLRGGQGNDSITGDAGNDVVQGDLGQDTLTGGAGSDIFVFTGLASTVAAPDTITDFTGGTDHISIGFAPAAILTGAMQTSLGAATTAAQTLLDGHAGDHEVAALMVGGDTYLFYASNAGATIDSAILLSNVMAVTVATTDFI